MKKIFLLLLILLVGVAGIIFWPSRRQPQNVYPHSLPITQVGQDNENKQVAQTKPNPSQTTSNSKPVIPAAVMEYVQKIKADPQYDWKQPINFYGRVVDESNNPVSGANVYFQWTDISPTGTSQANVQSGNDGFFSLTGQHGKRLIVEVSKSGYYGSGNSKGAAFEYANPADGLFTPNPNNPVIFHLRKKGIGANLITSEYGVKPYFGVTVPLDGTPVQVDLLERKTGQGALVISQVKPEYKSWKQATNWVFHMEIPNGGFIGQNDEFPFTAPDDGYQSVAEFSYQKDQPGWVENLKTNYYIKFGNPPRYGWLKLDTSILMSGARLTYAINPTGSRNLEPK